MPDRTLVQTPQGEVKKLTIDEFVELEKTTIFKKNEGHEKVAKLDKQGNPVKKQTRESCISGRKGQRMARGTRRLSSIGVRVLRWMVLYQSKFRP